MSKKTVQDTRKAAGIQPDFNADIMEQILSELETQYPSKKAKENVPTGTEFP
jgi:hypothetical protein